MNLEINDKKKTRTFTNTQRLNNMLWTTMKQIKNHPVTNENGNTTYPNLHDAAKAVLRQSPSHNTHLRNKKILK